MKLFLPLFLFSPLAAFSAVGGGAFQEVFFQSFNFILFVALLVFFVRKPLKAFYKSRRENFLQFEETARIKEEKIRAEFAKWRDKLEKMRLKEQTAEESARREGEVFQNKKARELQDLKERKHREIQFFLRLESEKMKREMLKNFKSSLAEGTAEELKALGADPAFHKGLHQNFIKNLRAGFEKQ